MRNISRGLRNKNPMIEYEQNQPKIQKPQKYFVQKFQRRCMKNVIKMKRKGYLGRTKAWGQKLLKIIEEENDKGAWIGSVKEEKEEKRRKDIWKVKNTWLKLTFLFYSFKTRSVEHWSGTNRARHKVFYKNFKIFDRSKFRFDQSKNQFWLIEHQLRINWTKQNQA